MYGLMKSLAANLLMPLPIMAAVFVLGAAMFLRGSTRRGLAVCFFAVVSLLLLAWAPVADRLVGTLESRYSSIAYLSEEDGIEAIVLLGGGWNPHLPLHPSAQLSDSSALRLLEAVRLWHLHPDLKLVVTGRMRGQTDSSIAYGYAQAAEALGVSIDAIVRLDDPEDTGQEALAVAELLGEGAQIVLVTSASHMPRSMQHFKRAGLRPLAFPTQFMAGRDARTSIRYWIPAAHHLEKSERAIYEALGLLALQWEGGL